MAFKLTTRIDQTIEVLQSAKADLEGNEFNRNYAAAIGKLRVARNLIGRINGFLVKREVDEVRKGL